MPLIGRIAAATARAYGLFANIAQAVDPYFNYVVTLLHGDGTNGGQNNTFLDSSSNNFTITRNGNTTQGSFSPFSQTGWSGYFDGSGDYCTLSSNASMDFGAGNFTIECFVNTGVFSISAGASRTIIGNSGNSYTMQLYIETGSGKVVFGNTGSTNLQGTGTVADNQWHHIVVVRSGTGSNQTALFIDGQRQAVGTNSQNYSSGTIYLGAFDTGNGFWNGYISNLRIVKGTAVYDPTATTLTVPTTPLTAVSNTALLTFQSNRFLDNSTNAYTVTKAGDTSIQPFSPFNSTTPYSTSAVGGSGYFDGSGDYLTVASNAAFGYGTGDFTIEMWIYPTVIQGASTPNIFDQRTANPQVVPTLYINNGQLIYYVNGLNRITGATLVAGQWYHLAVCRASGSTRMFVNGVQSGSTYTDANNYVTSPITIFTQGPAAAIYQAGYCGDLRVVKGTALYTTTFTPPTSPLTAISGTSLLLNYTNGAIFDNAAVADYETVGNAQISTSVKKYGTGSISLDGNGDYLFTPSNQTLAFGTADFTIEFWVYFNAVNTIQVILDFRPNATASSASPDLYLNSDGTLRWFVSGADRITSGALSASTWYHVAICRVASQTKLFINGTQSGSTYADTTSYLQSGAAFGFNRNNGGTSFFYLNGYIDDLRISNGIGRYPYNFTPPTAEFPNIGGTVTLTADPYFDYTTLLLPGNGTNGAQNNTFLDSSSNAFSITRNGNTTQGTFSPFSQTGWGNFFPTSNNGSDNLSIASNAALSFTASDDITVEAWINLSAHNTFSYICSKGNSSTREWAFGVTSTDIRLYWSTNGTSSGDSVISASYAFQLNTWYHVAACKSGSSVRLFVNGTQQGTTGTFTSIYNGSNPFRIATFMDFTGISHCFAGYISNFRFVKGTAVYTSNFTPSTTPLTAITNTSLLTCQSNRFIDNSTNNFAITRNGDVSVQAFSPFNPTAAWSAATNGGSGYFDGSGDYLTVADNAALQMGSGDFTVEYWWYPNNITSYQNPIDKGYTGAGALLLQTGNGDGRIIVYASGSAVVTSSTAVAVNAWNHMALVRSGTTLTLYQNGVSVGSATNSTNFNSTAPLGIGATATAPGGGGVGSFPVVGYLSGVRFVKGTAIYSGSTYTIPTAPLTAITNTSLLLNYTNAGIYDATSKNDLETVGNAQISTTQSKFGGSSMYFDGTGDWLIGRSSVLASFGTGDFTIEGWLYPSAVTGADRCLWDTRAAANDTGMVVFIDTNGKISTYTSGAIRITSTNALTANTWQHFALCRYNGTMAVYINGIQNGTLAYSTTITCPGRISVAVRFDDAAPYTGYIDDFRVTPGIARYTSNFTPPTTAFLTL